MISNRHLPADGTLIDAAASLKRIGGMKGRFGVLGSVGGGPGVYIIYPNQTLEPRGAARIKADRGEFAG